MLRQRTVFLSLILLACAVASAEPPKAAATRYTTRTLALPGGGADGIYMDYLAYDPRTDRVWVPASNTGAVDVVDGKSGKIEQVSGFPISEIERRGRKRLMGPTAASVGEGVVFVGNRGDSTICAVDARTLARKGCGHLDAMPDSVAYVAATKEVWVTTPRDKSIRILDATTLAERAKLSFDGEPEGFAVDAGRGRFYTNLEDKDRTLAIDLRTRKTVATWNPGCGEDGPHGLSLDGKAGFLFVACSARAEVLDAGHDGKILSKIDTGDGVDNLDYAAGTRKLYVAAAGAGKLTIASVDDKGQLSLDAQVPTKPGARNGVVTDSGDVYVAHSQGSELVVVSPVK